MKSKWLYRMLAVAELVAEWSKDPSTKVGAVICDKDNRIVSQGFNGLPRGVVDLEERLNERAIKYEMVVHAEVNAILFAKRDLADCILFCTHSPCSRCAAIIIQSGIRTVVAYKPPEGWQESCKLAADMFRDAQVNLIILDPLGKNFKDNHFTS